MRDLAGSAARRAAATPLLFLFFLAAAVALPACGRYDEPLPEPVAVVEPPAPRPAPSPPTSAASAPRAASAGAEDWNAAQIDWQGYEAGLARAKATRKPICLVLFTDWCPHCRNYSKVFADPRVVEKARAFVMIKVNADHASDVSERYQPDGGYVPRTFFLSPEGVLDAQIQAPRQKFRHFYDERDPASLLAAMSTAAQKLAK